MSRRSRIVGFGSAGLLVVLGVVCAAVFGGTLGQNLAFALVALGLVEGTALLFYEVGLTEDHDRARQEEGKRRPAHPPASPARPLRRPLDRMRGRPRRLR